MISSNTPITVSNVGMFVGAIALLLYSIAMFFNEQAVAPDKVATILAATSLLMTTTAQ